MADYLLEDSLIGLVYGKIFLEFSMTLKLDREQFCLKLVKLPIIDIRTESNGWTLIRGH